MKNVLVTGSGGFIGKALLKRLAVLGYNVSGIDIGDGNLTALESLDSFKDKNISDVFHLAARTFIPESWSVPWLFYQVNVMGTMTSLEFCRETGAKLTYISSYLYGQPDYLPIDERHPVKVYNPYNHSKNVAEDICRFYRDNFHLEVTILRPFNAYGTGQDDRFIIPGIIRQVLDPRIEKVEVMDLRPKRDYIYIDDLVEALILSMDAPRDIYNLGSGHSLSVEEIISLVFELTGIHKSFISKNVQRPNEIFDLYADITKISTAFHWQPRTSFSEGLSACIQSFLKAKNGE